MGKIKEIKNRFESLEQNTNLISAKLVEFDSFKEDMTDLQEKFNQIYELFTQEEEEISEEEQKKLMEEQMEQMKGIVQGAIIDMINKEENQKAIQEFVGQFMQGVSGAGSGVDVFGMGFDQLTNKDGELDLMKALFAFIGQKGKGTSSAPNLTGTTGKTGAY